MRLISFLFFCLFTITISANFTFEMIPGNSLELPPSNDNCSGAISISINDIVSVDYTTATFSGYQSCYNTGNDLWFTFTSNTSGNIIITNNGSGYPRFSVNAGSACGALTNEYCGQFGPGASKNINGLTPNTQHYLQITNPASNDAIFTFDIENGPNAPSNDECSGAILRTLDVTGCTNFSVNLAGATNSGNPPNACGTGGGYDAWYEFVAPASGNVIFEYNYNSSSPSYAYYTVYDACSGNEVACGSASKSSNTDESYITNLTPGQNYKIVISRSSFSSSYAVGICLRVGETSPINDDCNNAVEFDLNSASCTPHVSESYFLTPSSTPVPSCDNTATKDLWYTFTATSVGSANLELTTSFFSYNDITVVLYSGNCNGFTELECFESTAFHTFANLNQGTQYYVRILSQSPDEWSNLEVCITEGLPAPPNDLCNNAILLSPTASGAPLDTINGYTTLATDSGVPSPGCNYMTDIWYRFNAPSTGAIEIDLHSSSFTSYVNIYAGNCGNLGEFASCTSLSTFNNRKFGGFTPNQTYYLRMWNGNASQGFIDWSLIEGVAGPANDACQGAISVSLGDDICGQETPVSFVNSTNNINSSCFANRFDLWYSFLAPPSGHVLVNLVSHNFQLYYDDGGLAVFEGSCGSTNELQCIAFDNGINTMDLTNLTPGSTYYIVAFSNDPSKSLSFCAAAVPSPPLNDICSAATQLNISTNDNCNAQISGSTYGATDLFTDCNLNSEEVFYQVSISEDGNYTFTLSNFSNALNLAIYEENCPTNQVGCGNEELIVPLESGKTYTIIVSCQDNTLSSNFDLCAYKFEGSNGNNNSSVGINVENPAQNLQVKDGIMIGNTELGIPGSIRFKAGDFEGYTSNGWTSFTDEVVTDNLGNHQATQNLNLNNNRINNVASPSNGSDVANKAYVDGHTDADSDDQNEIQNISLNGNVVTLSNGGGSITLPDNGGSGLWNLGSNDDLYYDDGPVGIGTNSPEEDFDLRGNQQIITNSTSSANPHLHLIHSSSTGYNRLKFSNNGIDEHSWLISARSDDANNLNSQFHIFDGGQGGGNRFTVLGNGRIGVNKSTGLEDRFSINSATGENAFRVQVNGSTKLRVFSNGGVVIGANPGGGVLSNSLYVANRLGVGTASPDHRISAVGRISAANESAEINTMSIGHDGQHAYLNAEGLGRMEFRHEDNTRMVLDETGWLGVGIGANTPAYPLIVGINGTGTDGNGAHVTKGGTWTNTSSRSFKENIAIVNPMQILDKLAELDVSTWNYIKSDEGTHIGPIAEEFFATFGFGDSEKHISTVDADGVALAAIKALYELDQNSKNEIEELKKKNEDLERRLIKLEKLLEK